MSGQQTATARNIVLCCDGTSNEFSADRTNVVKLYQTLIQDDRQLAYYHPGLGTMEPSWTLMPWRRQLMRTMGLAFGLGLTNDIRDAYVYLMRHYREGDRLYLFGFSRGAYTVRALAALLHMYGLLREGNEPHVPYAIRMMGGLGGRHDKSGSGRAKQIEEFFDLAREFKDSYSRKCKPYFVGVWDTVNSVGWVSNPLKLPYTANNPDIEIGRHALAIDERRSFFRQNLWLPAASGQSGPKDLKQVWFPGSHGDVGGGYPQTDSGLSNIALQWMAKEAVAKGLRINPEKLAKIMATSTTPTIHDQLKGVWTLGEFVFKGHARKDPVTQEWKTDWYPNLFQPRRIEPGSLVHTSAFKRPNYKPRNWPASPVETD